MPEPEVTIDSEIQTEHTSTLPEPAPLQVGRVIVAVCFVLVFGFLATVPLEWKSQAILGAVFFVVALIADRRLEDKKSIAFLMLLSTFCTTRYLWWRLSETFSYLAVNGAQTPWSEIAVVLLLLAAEVYAFLILVLGYFQNVRPLGRRPVPLPENPSTWPSVDVFIPTFNEPVEVVRATVLAAQSMDWPKEKLRVHVLDDGKRPEVHDLAESCGVNYFARLDNAGAKAGNINHALKRTNAEFIAVFDCDHVPTRSFLQMTMGLAVANRKLAMVQTPHHFYSPDPFERNLDTFRRVPSEGELFYGVVQDGNDFWNSAFFCGSCAVLRRSALDQVGGVATETVTEDSHTALRLQKLGWHTAYLKLPQAAGLATANIADHIKQRIRWARGMVQVLRVEKPLFSRKLSMAQRLCYFNSGLHFLHAGPRLIFLTAPLVYLLLGISNLYGYVWAILAYVTPHLLLAAVTNSRIHGRYRHSFWNEVFETVLAPYILIPTLLALVNPRWGRFNVTPKRSVVAKDYFDLSIATPFLLLLVLNVAGLAVAGSRLSAGVSDPGTLLVNMLWTSVNVLILGAALAVMWEKKQVRPSSRIDVRVPARLRLDNGMEVTGVTLDLSLNGVAMQLDRPLELRAGDRAWITMTAMGEQHELPVEVRREDGLRLGLRFLLRDLSEHWAVTRLIFGRADAWVLWNDGRQEDRPMRSLGRLIGISLWSILSIPKGLFRRHRTAAEPGRSMARRTATTGMMLFAAGLAWSSMPAHAAEPFIDQRDLSSLGFSRPVEFRGGIGQATFNFGVPLTKIVTDAGLTLRFRTSNAFRPDVSKIEVTLNGVAIETVNYGSATVVDDLKQVQVALPSELIVADNALTVRWNAVCLAGCREGADWFRVEPSTSLRLSGTMLPLANNLGLLPVPFVDTTLRSAVRVPFVFNRAPDSLQLQAAGVLASWIGAMADDRGAAFPTRIGDPVSESAIVFAPTGSPILEKLGLQQIAGPFLALRDNPVDAYGKLLVISGANGSEVLTAAQALATGAYSRQGDVATLAGFSLQGRSVPYDAPRWLDPENPDGLTKNASPERLKVYGSGAVDLYFRLPPDLSFGQRSTVPLRLNFRSSGAQAAMRGEVRVRLNGIDIASAAFTPAETSTAIRQTVQLPVGALYPKNTLTIEFAYTSAAEEGRRTEVFPEASILQTTTIDLRGIPRYVQLPRMDLFAEMGFPFTRLADLSETAVVMPAEPDEDLISLFLGLMARFGGQTGNPGVRLTVVSDANAPSVADKDLLVLGTATDRQFLSPWIARMPVQLDSAGVRLTPVSGFRDWLRRIPFTSAYEEARRLTEMTGERVDGLIQGSSSPVNSSRNAVLVIATDAPALPQLILSLSSGASLPNVHGTVSTFRDGSFQSFHIDTDASHLGRLSWRENVYNWLADRFWVLVAAVVLIGVVLARWFTEWSDQHAALRIQGAR